MSERADHNERASVAINLPVVRLLNVDQAAAYVGLSADSFMVEVAAGTFPGPVALRRVRRNLWDRMALDRALNRALDAQMGGSVDDWDARKAAWTRRRQDRPQDAR